MSVNGREGGLEADACPGQPDGEHAAAPGRRYLIQFVEDTLRERPIVDLRERKVHWHIRAGDGARVINHHVGDAPVTVKTAGLTVGDNAGGTWGEATPGTYVALEVTDTGSGIPDDIIDRVCDPFFTTKTEGTGTGLGLATVYGIVRQAGGFLRIDSEPGTGTTVTALLPAASHVADPQASLPQYPRRGTGQTMLLVEDEAAMREVTAHILARNGYQVLTAAGGAEALTILQAQRPPVDVLLTDVIMPQMAGRELGRARRIQPGLRVLFMSGYAHGLLTSQGLPGTGVHLLDKPFDQARLLEARRDVLISH